MDHSLAAAEGDAVRCLACARRCLLRAGSVGYCTAVGNVDGHLTSLAFGVVSEATVTPIENRPVYHFRPGTRVLSLGGLGCQLRCLLGPVLDVYRVDLKSLDHAFYRRVAHIDRVDEVLPVARRARRRFGIHVEAVTSLMPGLNDGDDHLSRLAERIAAELGPPTPWHLTSYVPYAHMTDVPPTPAATLGRARAIGLARGLRFVYTDGAGGASTHCPDCGTLAVERQGPVVRLRAVRRNGRCAVCASSLGMVP